MIPSTIKYPKTFLKSPAAGFDGVFDWTWTEGCFGNKNITPMDFDGVVERKGKFIVFETKNLNTPVPLGQMYTFEALYKLGVFTILFIEGKSMPEKVKIWCQPNFAGGQKMTTHVDITVEYLKGFVSEWYKFADGGV